MKVSRNFLSDYLDVSKIDFAILKDEMLHLGHEYDEYQKLVDATNLVVGKVVDCVKHPDSDKLSICQVDVGGEIKQIVCGASNVATGQKVVVAKVGAVLPGDFKIKKIKVAGVYSDGMICSFAELILDKRYLSEKDHQEIMVLDDHAVVGEDALVFLELNDEIIDFDLTANRADLLSILGMAYEIGALYNLSVNYPEIAFKEIKESINDNYRLQVSTEKCQLYLAKLVKNVVIKESPNYIKNRLMASGIRPLNNVVDISNYVMLETGQPIHFFDADKVSNLGVRLGKNEEIQTLDGFIHKIDQNDILITDNDKPIALAGIMGGLATEVTNETKNIIIEAAIFNPTNIRKTSKKTLRSEASMRFEKGIAKERTFLALKRACYLLEKHASGKVAKDMLKHDILKIKEKTITIDVDFVNAILGLDLKKKALLDTLNRLQLPYQDGENIAVLIPERRLDLSIPEDLVEEIGRFAGFNNIKGVLPTGTLKSGRYDDKLAYLRQINNYLIGKGLKQTINYSLVTANECEPYSEKKAIKIIEPVSKEREFLRTALIPSLLHVYNYNHARSFKDIAIFEIGAIYYQTEKYIENNKLGLLLSGNYIENKWQQEKIVVDFYLLKGLIEELLIYQGFANRYQFVAYKNDNFHPYQTAKILVDNEEIGVMGKIHPKLANNVYVSEIDLDKLYDYKIKNIKYREPIKYPAIIKDVAFLVNEEVISADIEKVIKKAGGRLLETIDVFDVYQKDGQKSIAYSLTFRDENKTLSDEEVMVIFNRIIGAVEEKVGAKVRDN